MFVDVNAALEELGLELDDFNEFVGDLKDFLNDALPNLREACESQNFSEIVSQAHAIKGALANLRFVHSAEIAKTLEFRGRESNSDRLVELIGELENSVQASFAEVAP